MERQSAVESRVGCLAVMLRGILAVLLGLLTGAALNMGVLVGGMALLPAPEGVDIQSVESLNENIHRYSVLQMLVPFLAHALGTLLGAFVAATVAATRGSKRRAALLIGCVFLIAGIDMVLKIPNAPLWFDVLDLCVAYIPMAVIGWRLAVRGKDRA